MSELIKKKKLRVKQPRRASATEEKAPIFSNPLQEPACTASLPLEADS